MKNGIRARVRVRARARFEVGSGKSFANNFFDYILLFMKNILSENEIIQLKAQHKKERDKRICDRIKAVLLYDKGWSYQEIAEALLLSDEAVRIHINDYQTLYKLKPENGGSPGKLSDQQTKDLLDHLQKHTYLYSKDIIDYVNRAFSIQYTIPGMISWLKAHGFSYKKPAVVPGKANREAQEQWILEYEKLKSNLLPNEAICFIDGVHPTHNTKPSYGWIKKGVRKEIPTNTGRQRLNLSGAIDVITRKVLVREDTVLNAKSTIEFLRDLENAYPKAQQVHVFCDNARYYKNKEVAKFLDTSKIQMHFLPSYSPNLNPIERLWKLMNEYVLYNRYYEKFDEFKESILGFLESLADPPRELMQVLKNRITDNFQIFGDISKKKVVNGLF
jgi:transposase